MILVSGASGLLGSNLMLAASDRGHTVEGLFFRQAIQDPGFKMHCLDLRDRDATRSMIDELRPEWIVHCAAQTNVDWCELHPLQAMSLNADSTRLLAERARAVGARLVFISTDAVFDGRRGGYVESDRTNPVNVYAASKLGGELAIREIGDNFLILRTSIYGWNATNKKSLAEWFLDCLELGQEVPGLVDVVGSLILVNDLSDIILDLIEMNAAGTFHSGAKDSCSKYEFGRSIARVFGISADQVIPSRVESLRLGATRPKNTSLNCDLVEKCLGRPMPSIESGLMRFRELRSSEFRRRLRSAAL